MQNRNKLDLGEDPNHVGIESRHRRGRAPESYNELEMSQATAMQHYQGYLDTSLHLEAHNCYLGKTLGIINN